ncbi:MAG: flagellar hook-basal body complex protein FliE [Candidatus Margulisiibacteriota bacterium]
MSELISSIGGLSSGLGLKGLGGKSDFVSEFSSILKDNFESTNALLNRSDSMTQNFAVDKAADLHDVMIAVEEAGMSLNYMMQIRNKLVEGYQELMRTQV